MAQFKGKNNRREIFETALADAIIKDFGEVQWVE
jgi:hypothetical protein